VKRDKTVDALNRLVEVNNDRIEGYKTAASETDEQAFKALFGRFAQASRTCRTELAREITSLAGTPTVRTKNSGKLFRAWMDVKAALTSNGRKGILASCAFGEASALVTYENVLYRNQEHLSPSHISMINKQMSMLKGEYGMVKSIRNELRMYT